MGRRQFVRGCPFSARREAFALCLVASLLFLAVPLSAQSSRADVKIFIPRPESKPGLHEQEDFFAEQFKMEITAASYTVTDKHDEADYLIQLIIEDNEYWGEPGEKQFALYLLLVRAHDNYEMVRFSWPFTEMTEMYSWNLYLVYQAMALVPMTKEAEEPSRVIVEREIAPALDERWRNKILYLSGGVGPDMGYYLRPDTYISDLGYVLPTAALGLEWHFVNFLSLEAQFRARFMHDKQSYLFTPGAAVLAKAVLKPGSVMLEIYGGAEYDIAPPSLPGIPWLSAIGGVQAGVRGGARSAVTIDFSVAASLLGGMSLAEDEAPYRSIKFCFLIGYKIGWRDLPKKSAAAPP